MRSDSLMMARFLPGNTSILDATEGFHPGVRTWGHHCQRLGLGIMIKGKYLRQGQGERCGSLGVLKSVSWRESGPRLSLDVHEESLPVACGTPPPNSQYYWARDLMFFTSSSSLSDCLVPWCPLMSTWHQRFSLGDGSSRKMSTRFSEKVECDGSNESSDAVAHRPSSLLSRSGSV